MVPFIPTSKYVLVLVESVFLQNFHSDEKEQTYSYHNTRSHKSRPAAVNPALFGQLITGIKHQLHSVILSAPQVYNYKSTMGHTVTITPKNTEPDNSQQNNSHWFSWDLPQTFNSYHTGNIDTGHKVKSQKEKMEECLHLRHHLGSHLLLSVLVSIRHMKAAVLGTSQSCWKALFIYTDDAFCGAQRDSTDKVVRTAREE